MVVGVNISVDRAVLNSLLDFLHIKKWSWKIWYFNLST